MEQRRTALLIATDKYDDPTFAQLEAPVNDVAGLAEVLRDPEIGAFAVRVLLNEPHYVVRREIGRICAEAHRDDLILFYVSGHGIKEEDSGSLHFVTKDTGRGDLSTSSVEAEVVSRQIDRSRARQAIVWLDCCYSGAFPAGGTPKSAMDADVLSQMKLEGRGTFVMTASTHIQYAYEPSQAAKATGATTVSVFTEAIIEGLRTGAADVDGDGEIGTADLYEYVYQHVRARTPNQTPTRKDQVSGELLVARNRFALHLPAGLAPNIRNLLRDPDPKMRQLAIDHLGNETARGDELARETLVVLRSNRDLDLAGAAGKALDRASPPPRARVRSKPPTHRATAADWAYLGQTVERFQTVTGPQPAREPEVEQRRPPEGQPPMRISPPEQSKPRIAAWQQVLGGVEVAVIGGSLGYMSFAHEASGLLTVLWAATVLVVGVALFDLGRLLRTLYTDKSTVLNRVVGWSPRGLAFSPDGRWLAGQGTVWNTDTWRENGDGPGPACRVVYSPDNRVVAEISGAGTVVFRRSAPYRQAVSPGNGVAFSPEGRLAAISRDDRVNVVHVDSGDVVAALDCVARRPHLMTFDPTGRFLVVVVGPGVLRLRFYETTSWAAVDLPPEIDNCTVFAFDHDGSHLAVATPARTVDLWRVADWRKQGSLSFRAQPTCVDFSADGRSMAVGDQRGRITLYSTMTWGSWSMGWHHGSVEAVRFGPDSSGIIASTGKDRTLRLWEAG